VFHNLLADLILKEVFLGLFPVPTWKGLDCFQYLLSIDINNQYLLSNDLNYLQK